MSLFETFNDAQKTLGNYGFKNVALISLATAECLEFKVTFKNNALEGANIGSNFRHLGEACSAISTLCENRNIRFSYDTANSIYSLKAEETK